MQLVELARCRGGENRLSEIKLTCNILVYCECIDETGAQRLLSSPEGAPLRAHEQRFACHQASCAVAHGAPANEATLHDNFRLDAEKSGTPQHHVGDFAWLKRPDKRIDPERSGSVDRVFGDVAFDAFIVAALAFFARQSPPLILHF